MVLNEAIYLKKKLLSSLNSFSASKFDKKSEHQNNILTELYDSLDKKSPPSKMDLDSLDINLNTTNNSDTESTKNFFDSLELNVWGKSSCVSKNAALHLENVLMKQSTNLFFGSRSQIDRRRFQTSLQRYREI